MKTANLIPAKVKYPVDRIRKTKYGDRIKLVAARDDGGDDIELWDKPEAPIHYLSRGTPLQILWDGERYSLLAVPDQANGNGHQDSSAPTPEVRANLSNLSVDVKEWIAIFEEIRLALPNAQESTWRAAASTIFIKRCEIRQDFENGVF